MNALIGKLGQSAVVESSFEQNVSAYEAWDGTSMATPHVSGVAALVWSAFPNLTNVQIRNALTGSALDLGTAGRDVYYGFGLVQAKNALVSLGWIPLPTSTPPTPTPTPTDTPTATPTTPTPTDTPTPTPTTPTPTDTPTSTPVPGGTIALTVTTDKTVYSINQTVYITVVTKDNNVPLSGVAISGEIISPSNRAVASFSGTTGTSGEVTFSYRVKRNVGTGTFTVNTTATKTGFTPASSTIHFTVQ